MAPGTGVGNPSRKLSKDNKNTRVTPPTHPQKNATVTLPYPNHRPIGNTHATKTPCSYVAAPARISATGAALTLIPPVKPGCCVEQGVPWEGSSRLCLSCSHPRLRQSAERRPSGSPRPQRLSWAGSTPSQRPWCPPGEPQGERLLAHFSFPENHSSETYKETSTCPNSPNLDSSLSRPGESWLDCADFIHIYTVSSCVWTTLEGAERPQEAPPHPLASSFTFCSNGKKMGRKNETKSPSPWPHVSPALFSRA